MRNLNGGGCYGCRKSGIGDQVCDLLSCRCSSVSCLFRRWPSAVKVLMSNDPLLSFAFDGFPSVVVRVAYAPLAVWGDRLLRGLCSKHDLMSSFPWTFLDRKGTCGAKLPVSSIHHQGNRHLQIKLSFLSEGEHQRYRVTV